MTFPLAAITRAYRPHEYFERYPQADILASSLTQLNPRLLIP